MPDKKFMIRSFVHRGRKLSATRSNAVDELWDDYVLNLELDATINLRHVFGRDAVTNIEIGFGTGENLYIMAASSPNENFIGIEVYRPGVAALLTQIQQNPLSNIRIFANDAVEVLMHAIPENSINAIFILFPDPWPKRRHHCRRLIQIPFIKLIYNKLQHSGRLHMATDSEDYARHIAKIMQHFPDFTTSLENCRINQCVTKFEQKGLCAGREVTRFCFIKK